MFIRYIIDLFGRRPVAGTHQQHQLQSSNKQKGCANAHSGICTRFTSELHLYLCAPKFPRTPIGKLRAEIRGRCGARGQLLRSNIVTVQNKRLVTISLELKSPSLIRHLLIKSKSRPDTSYGGANTIPTRAASSFYQQMTRSVRLTMAGFLS